MWIIQLQIYNVNLNLNKNWLSWVRLTMFAISTPKLNNVLYLQTTTCLKYLKRKKITKKKLCDKKSEVKLEDATYIYNWLMIMCDCLRSCCRLRCKTTNWPKSQHTIKSTLDNSSIKSYRFYQIQCSWCMHLKPIRYGNTHLT